MVVGSPSVAALILPRHVAGPPSSTFAPPFRDPQHVYGIPKSSARMHGLHPPNTSAYASPVCWRSEPQRCAASCVHGRGEFLLSSRDPARVPPGCLTWRPMSSWHVLEPGAHRLHATVSWCRKLDSWTDPCVRSSTSGQWKRSSTISPPPSPNPPTCSQLRSTVTGDRQPLRGLQSGGSSCSAPPFAGYSSSFNTHLAAIIASHLRGKPAARGLALQAVILLRYGNAHASC